jgi:hypothetical protein
MASQFEGYVLHGGRLPKRREALLSEIDLEPFKKLMTIGAEKLLI